MKDIRSYVFESPPYLRDILIFFIWVFLILAVAELVFLLLHKAILERRAKRFKQKKVIYFSSITRNFIDANHCIEPPADLLETNALIDVCIDIMTGASRKNIEIIHKIVREFGIPTFLVRNYNKNSLWLKQYQIIETLGFLKLPELARVYREIIDEESVLLEKYRGMKKLQGHGWLSDVQNPATRHLHLISKALWALSCICTDFDFWRIIHVLQTPSFMSGKYNEYIFCNIIGAYRHRDQIEELLKETEKLLTDRDVPPLIKRDFIQACGIARFTESHAMVAKCSDTYSESPEIKIACIRTLSLIGDERLEELTLRCLEDDDWRVRTVAAKDAYLCSDAIIPPLHKMLCDSSYYVRLNAALSLARKGDAGKTVLMGCLNSSDKYEQDMASFALKQV
jgi:hypothetical protein